MIFLCALLLSGTSYSADFSYENLKELIESQGLKSVEEVLPKLPVEMRSNYVLMHKSRSLQAARPESPRAIMFAKDGKLTCSFNGDPNDRGYDLLECVQFRDAEAKFDFRQIQFPTEKNGLSSVQFSLSNQTINKKVSCTACHTSDPRPNWNNYNSWPGAYGEIDDTLKAEEANFKIFSDIRYNHPRYQWLTQENYWGAPFRKYFNDVGTAHRPNFRLTDLYGRLNALRAARIVNEKLPAWERWAYVSSALHCNLSSEQVEKFTKAGLDPSADLQLDKIFKDIGVKSYEWSTQFRADKQQYPDKPWEHQSGFSLFSETVAMALIQERAKSGNSVFAASIEKIKAYYSTVYFDYDLEFNKTMNEIVPSPDFFGKGYEGNLGLLCPEATNIFTEEYLRAH